jgi:hypothetical protein
MREYRISTKTRFGGMGWKDVRYATEDKEIDAGFHFRY